MYECYKYLRDNGYTVKSYTESVSLENAKLGNENIEEWRKDFDEYTITIRCHTNFYGGKDVIEVRLKPQASGLAAPSIDYHRMEPPMIAFFATGYHDYPALEKMVKEDIVPSLKRWAIEVI